MGASSPKLCQQIEVLKEFRRYESEFYTYFYKNELKEDLHFYLVPKNYIINLCSKFDYSKNTKELDNLLLYMKHIDAEKENKKILNIIINCLKNSNQAIINNNEKLPKINNESIIIKRDNNIYFKISSDCSYIPLNKDIWKTFLDNYDSDIILEKKGFVNNGEIFLEIEYKRLDCFFTLFETNDIIYHYCFVLDDIKEYDNLIKYLKGKNPINSVRYLLLISNININTCEVNTKFRIKIDDVDKLINNYDITIYFLGSFKFKDSAEENINLLKNTKSSLYSLYKTLNNNIKTNVKEYKNTHTNIH